MFLAVEFLLFPVSLSFYEILLGISTRLMSPMSNSIMKAWSSWPDSYTFDDAHEAYRTHMSTSVLSSASETSTTVTRTDVSPLFLNGNTSSRETSPATSTGSSKTRRLSDAVDVDDDLLGSLSLIHI